jgi:hypothetical protein
MYASWEYNVPFQQSPRFDVQLDSKSIQVFDKRGTSRLTARAADAEHGPRLEARLLRETR